MKLVTNMMQNAIILRHVCFWGHFVFLKIYSLPQGWYQVNHPKRWRAIFPRRRSSIDTSFHGQTVRCGKGQRGGVRRIREEQHVKKETWWSTAWVLAQSRVLQFLPIFFNPDDGLQWMPGMRNKVGPRKISYSSQLSVELGNCICIFSHIFICICICKTASISCWVGQLVSLLTDGRQCHWEKDSLEFVLARLVRDRCYLCQDGLQDLPTLRRTTDRLNDHSVDSAPQDVKWFKFLTLRICLSRMIREFMLN